MINLICSEFRKNLHESNLQFSQLFDLLSVYLFKVMVEIHNTNVCSFPALIESIEHLEIAKIHEFLNLSLFLLFYCV